MVVVAMRTAVAIIVTSAKLAIAVLSPSGQMGQPRLPLPSIGARLFPLLGVADLVDRRCLDERLLDRACRKKRLRRRNALQRLPGPA
jgi:hypothetical protein